MTVLTVTAILKTIIKTVIATKYFQRFIIRSYLLTHNEHFDIIEITSNGKRKNVHVEKDHCILFPKSIIINLIIVERNISAVISKSRLIAHL
jgi:hypothetical protein